MKILVLLLGLMLLAPVCMADNFLDDASDVIKCRNEDFPVRVYTAVTITENTIPFLGTIGADWRTKISTATGEMFCKEGIVETGLEYRF